MHTVDENREFSRIEMPVRVEIDRPGHETFKGLAEDVSLNGIRIASDVLFDANTPCDIRVMLGTDGGEGESVAIEARGCAVRSDGHVIAIHFDQLELEGYNHLKKLILYNSSAPDQVEREFNAHRGLHRKAD